MKSKSLWKKGIVLLLAASMFFSSAPVSVHAELLAESSQQVDTVTVENTEMEEADIVQTETDGQRLNYLYIEQPYLETPETQKVVVSWGDGTENIEKMEAVVQGTDGQEVWTATKEAETLYLFERSYTEQEKDVYQITELRVTIQGEVSSYSLSDLGVEAEFGVDEAYDGIEQLAPLDSEEVSADIAAYNIDESGNVTEQASMEDAIEQAAQSIPAVMSEDGVQTQSSNLVVALDPGHDSIHAGASANGVREEVLTLKIAQYCKAELEQYAGVSVFMTRTTADCPHPGGTSGNDIDQRVADAVRAGASIYVSIHLNSSTSSAPKGAEVIYPNSNWKPQVGADGKRLAQSIEAELVGIGLQERGIYSKDTTVDERYDDGSLSDYFTVQISAKEHGIPGIIVEHAFVTNTSDVNNYLNNEAGLKKLGIADANGIVKYFGLTKGYWVKDSKGWWYQSGSSYLRGQWAFIGGSWYYFGADGYMKSGWQKISNYWYYLGSSEDGSMKAGWQKINGSWYYLGSSGDGRMKAGWEWINGAWYNFGQSDDGSMKSGWYKTGGSWYYLGDSNDGSMKTGWRKIGGAWYYLDESGDGAMQTGWKFINGVWYYLGKSDDGSMKAGWIKINGFWYYLGGLDDGAMKAGWIRLNGNWYYLGGLNDGTMKVGWYEINGKKYYFDKTSGVMQTGWQQIEGTWYYFDADGVYDASQKRNQSELDDRNNVSNNTVEGTYLIEGDTDVTLKQMVSYYKQSKQTYPTDVMKAGGAATINEFCQIYIDEAQKEGIKAEVAFTQAMKETGWLQFQGTVKAEQYNFAGLGATGSGVTGETFKNVREGVRAQIQHLKAYGSTKDLNETCVDNRFKYVQRGSAIYVEWLGIPNNPNGKGWSTTDGYGVDIVKMIQKLKSL